jgi:transposase
MKLAYIFDNTYDKGVAFTKLARWYQEVEKTGFQTFKTIVNSIRAHYQTILNYFNNRSTNAAAESFNAKIKAFRATSRGVRDVKFFLYQLSKIYA